LKEQAILGELVTRFKQEQTVWDENEVAGRLGWASGVKAGLARAVEAGTLTEAQAIDLAQAWRSRATA
jgi:hypothetical protein